MARTKFEDLEVYRLAEKLSDEMWRVSSEWPQFAKDTVGKQLVRAADSVGANIAEGADRGTFTRQPTLRENRSRLTLRNQALVAAGLPKKIAITEANGQLETHHRRTSASSQCVPEFDRQIEKRQQTTNNQPLTTNN